MKPREPVAVDCWEVKLREMLLRVRGPLQRVAVLRETDSTQDTARRLDARVGDVIVAGRQTNGRGRLGRAWADTDEDGVAMTLVVARDRPERLAIEAAVAVCDALVALAKNVRVGIKWPNDIMMDGRKIAGILVEQFDDRALVGIGVNVGQRTFSPPLTDSAVSLHQLGVERDRLAVMGSIIDCFQWVLQASDAEIARRFAAHDLLSGQTAGFRVGDREIRGKVLRVDPMKGLAVLTENEGEVWLPATTTSVIKD